MAGLERLEVNNPYTHIPDAVNWFEEGEMGSSPEIIEMFWNEVRRQGISVDEFIPRAKVALIGTYNILPSERIRSAITQVDHPEFRIYVRAKLGAM